MRASRWIAAAVMILSVGGPARAERIMCFPADDYARESRTIVLVRQPDVKTDTVEVIECWLGDVPTGTALRVQWLDCLAAPEERTVAYGNGFEWGDDGMEEAIAAANGLPVPRVPPILGEIRGRGRPIASGAREVLFLGPVTRTGSAIPSATFTNTAGPSMVYVEDGLTLAPLRGDYFGAGLFPVDAHVPTHSVSSVEHARSGVLTEPDLREDVRAAVAHRASLPPSPDETAITELAGELPRLRADALRATLEGLRRDRGEALVALAGLLDDEEIAAGGESRQSDCRAWHIVETIERTAGFRTVAVLMVALDHQVEAVASIRRGPSEARDARLRARAGIVRAIARSLARTRESAAWKAIERARDADEALAEPCKEAIEAYRQ